MDRGCYVSRTEAERVTLGEVIDRYMAEVSPSKRGGKDEIIRLKAMKRHKMVMLHMAALSPAAVAGYRDDRLKECGAGAVLRDLAMLSSLVNHSRREWGISINNPVAMIRKPAMPQGRDRVLSNEEEGQLLAALAPDGRRNTYMHPLAIVAIETAMRRGELLGLKWADVDLTKRVAYLRETKNGDSRAVPLSTRTIETLLAMPRSIDGRVFPISVAAMEKAFKGATQRAGLDGLHFHDLRHTAATRLAGKLSNVLELSAVTGHKELRMLKKYYHPQAEMLAQKLA